jgi:O-antigen biosynthesis protein WbqP
MMIIVRNIFCIAGMALIVPVLLVVSIFLIIEDGYPIFFKQDRFGKDKKRFTIYKLRTMKKNAPQLGTHQVDDSYMLKTGKLIRACKLDEFPQLINVIKGDINLVGPRPGLLVQVELMEARDNRNIFSIKPGVTGLAQTLGYDMSNPEILGDIDRVYIENKSFKLNALIFLGTFLPVVRSYVSRLLKIKIKRRQ